MNIQIISDLHQEFGITDISFEKADIVILAGDIHTKQRSIEWIKSTIPSQVPVIYVLGNHEYYKGSYPKTLYKMKDLTIGSNIHILENESVEFDGVVFHGMTLWTDFSLFGNPIKHGIICQQKMNDYKYIRRDPSYSKMRTIDTYNIHQRSINWLENSLTKTANKTNIVVSNHAPSPQSLPNKYKQNPVSFAYASNLENFILKHQPKWWIHGHIHTPQQYKIGETEIICNPHGYIDDEYNGYQKELIKEL
ncbi:MAG: phosphoesterase [Cytophagales bacterium]|nr:phosphoesterase [Cytophagales bacterium]